MIGNLWFALLAFVLGAGLTYLRMAGRATRRVAKPVPHRLVMGGIIPGVVDAPADSLPTEIGPERQIRVGSTAPQEKGASVEEPPAEQGPAVETEPAAPEPIEGAVEAEATGNREEPREPDSAAAAESEPAEPGPTAEAADQDAARPDVAEQAAADQPDEASAQPGSAEPTSEPSEPLQRQIAAGATSEPPTSSWWAAAFDRGDPGPYPGPLRYSSAWPPAGSRVLDVDDEFAAALGAGAAASAASAALFGTTGRSASEPEPVRPASGRTSAPRSSVPSTPAEEAAAAASDEPSDEQLIKGNRDSMLYHTPDSPWYARTNAEELFHTEDEARAAGFSRWNSRSDKQRD